MIMILITIFDPNASEKCGLPRLLELQIFGTGLVLVRMANDHSLDGSCRNFSQLESLDSKRAKITAKLCQESIRIFEC